MSTPHDRQNPRSRGPGSVASASAPGAHEPLAPIELCTRCGCPKSECGGDHYEDFKPPRGPAPAQTTGFIK